MKTYSAKSEEIEKEWFVADAEGQTLGRFASKIAQVLRGKHKPAFTPHVDMGDFVIVVLSLLHICRCRRPLTSTALVTTPH